jgi:uncharacterized protein (TIGR00162 family)
MNETLVKLKKIKKPNRPIAIVGLPGIGNVGKLVAEHLRRELKAKKIGVIYSPHFPHQAIMLKSGRVRLVSNSIYLSRAKSAKASDIIILTGDVQAVSTEGQYAVNSKIFETLKTVLGCQFIYTIGGYNMGGMPSDKKRVFGNATSKNVIDRFKKTNILFGESRGLIWGSAGLIIAFARMDHLDGACLMGETNLLEFDAGAAKAVIIELSKVLEMRVNTDNLDKIIKQTEEAMKQMQQLQTEQDPMGGVLPLPQGAQQQGGEHRPSYIR